MTDAGERTVLITGAAGFVGQALAGELVAQGWRVTGLDRRAPTRPGPFAEFCEVDLLDPRALRGLPQRRPHMALVHLAGLRPGQPPGELFAVNVGGTAAALAELARPGCHFVFFSTGLVYGAQAGPFVESMAAAPADPYGQSKLAAEALVTAWGSGSRQPGVRAAPLSPVWIRSARGHVAAVAAAGAEVGTGVRDDRRRAAAGLPACR